MRESKTDQMKNISRDISDLELRSKLMQYCALSAELDLLTSVTDTSEELLFDILAIPREEDRNQGLQTARRMRQLAREIFPHL